jgi:hypothetical protein
MKNMLTLVICLCACMFSINLTASVSVVKLGDFSIDSIYSHNRFLLDDGNTYKPTNKHHANEIANWQLGDDIVVLRVKGRSNLFVLVNTARNNQVKAKIVSFATS